MRSILLPQRSAADAAEALLSIASDQASFITGVILPVDGGIWPAGR